MTTVYRLPPAFVADHIARDLLPETAVVREGRKFVDVELSGAQTAELLSDARHYADPDNGYRRDNPGLVMSAAATVERLVADHAFLTLDEGDGYGRAACACHASQASPVRGLTDEAARSWHAAHVDRGGAR